MTTTSVKDVSTVMQSIQTAAKPGTQSVKDGGFTEVFTRQTTQEPAEEVKSATSAKQPVKKAEDAKTTDVTDTTEAAGANVETTDSEVKVTELKAQDVVEEIQVPDTEELEKAMEVLVTAADQMITQIAQTFEISEDAVMQVMDEMGMEPLEVLKPDVLGNLMLEIGGAQDSMELLTNEALYSEYKAVMSELETVLEENAVRLDVKPEEMGEFIEELSLHFEGTVPVEAADVTNENVPMQVTEEIPVDAPVIEIIDETQVDADNEVTVQRQDEEIDIAGTKQFVESESPIKVQDEAEASGMTRDGRQNDSNAEQQENPILSQLGQNRVQSEVNQTTQTVSASFATDMETQDIMRQIMDYMRVQIKPDMSNVEMQLHPASLGTLQVQVASKGGVVTAQFITQSETVKAALESQMIQLQESFSAQGVRVEAIEVTVQTHQFESNLEQGRGNNQEPQERRNSRVRRLVLDGMLTTDELKDLNAEELLTARMMEANGNERK